MKTKLESWTMPLFITIAGAIIYSIIFCFLGHVPSITKIVLYRETAIEFPFVIYKFWDLLLIYLSVYSLTKIYDQLEKQGYLNFVMYLVSGLFWGAILGLTSFFLLDLTIIIFFGLLYGIFCSFRLSLKNALSLKNVLVLSLGLGLGACLISNLIVGLAILLSFSLIYIIFIDLGKLIKLIFALALNRNEVVCFLLKNDSVLLGLKTKKTGKGKWNGYGGKIKKGESPIEATIRELKEELGVIVSRDSLADMGNLDIISKNFWNQKTRLYIFICNAWQGFFKESDEMLAPNWFKTDKLPDLQMISTDRLWLPYVLKGLKVLGTVNKKGLSRIVLPE